MPWPSKVGQQLLCLWPLWARIPAGHVFSEAEVNALLNAHHRFGDPARLRRALVDAGLMGRTRDCREYRRIEQPPSPDAAALIRHLGRRPAA